MHALAAVRVGPGPRVFQKQHTQAFLHATPPSLDTVAAKGTINQVTQKTDAAFITYPATGERIAAVIEEWWPEQIDPHELGSPSLEHDVTNARHKLLEALDLLELA